MKLHKGAEERAMPTEFSPAFSGGLIEARRTLGRHERAGGFSPAFSGGLIEAELGGKLALERIAVLPRVQRGPH